MIPVINIANKECDSNNFHNGTYLSKVNFYKNYNIKSIDGIDIKGSLLRSLPSIFSNDSPTKFYMHNSTVIDNYFIDGTGKYIYIYIYI